MIGMLRLMMMVIMRSGQRRRVTVVTGTLQMAMMMRRRRRVTVVTGTLQMAMMMRRRRRVTVVTGTLQRVMMMRRVTVLIGTLQMVGDDDEESYCFEHCK